MNQGNVNAAVGRRGWQQDRKYTHRQLYMENHVDILYECLPNYYDKIVVAWYKMPLSSDVWKVSKTVWRAFYSIIS